MTSTDSTTTASPVDVLNTFFEKLGAGDLPALLDVIDENVDWKAAGDPQVPWTGQRHGKAAAGDFLATLGQYTEPVSFTVDRVLGDADTAVAVGAFAHRVLGTGKTFESEFVIRIGVVNGRIVRYRIFEDSYAVGQAFLPDNQG